jgi:hypothetical protein
MEGIGSGRNSSRVLNPPGGKSSDIFGSAMSTGGGLPGGAPTAEHVARNESTVFRSPVVARPASEPEAAANYRRNQSNIFSGVAPSPVGAGAVPWATAEAAPTQPVYAAREMTAPPAHAAAYTHPESPQRQADATESVDRQQAINPGSRGANTGDVLMSGHCGRNSSRVSQPPGGRSSIQFF